MQTRGSLQCEILKRANDLVSVTWANHGQEGVAFAAYGTGAIANMQNDPTAELMLHVFC